MIQSLSHTSENGNSYIYDPQKRLSLLVHPEFKKVHDESAHVDSYYFKKYEYLKKYGLFTEPKPIDFVAINESTVKECLIHIQQIVFETTDFCNLDCTYCGFGDLYEVEERNLKNINTNYAINLLKYIFNLKPKSKNNKLYIGFYGGEPLLNMEFIKRIVAIANQLNAEKEMDLFFSITTNATLIHKYIDFLVANKFSLLISLDGNEENHSYRIYKKNRKNSFQKVIENLDIIQKDYPDYFADHVRFNAVLHDRNSVKSISEFIFTRYHKIPKITELSPENVKPDQEDLYESMFHSKRKCEAGHQKDESDLMSLLHYESVQYQELAQFLKHFSINYYKPYITSSLHNEEKYLPSCTCLPFNRKIYLNTHNKLLVCEKISYKYSIGEVHEDVVIDISEITRQYNFYYDHLKKVCQNCYAYRFCAVCLFFIKELDKLGTEEFVCDRFHDRKTFQNKLSRIFSFLEKYPNDLSYILKKFEIE